MSRVLVVDDDPIVLKALVVNMRARGYDVHAARDGASALRVAGLRSPDLVVLELGLPDMEGTAVISGLRGWTTVPIIMLSVRDAEADKVRALDAGADDYVSKPFSAGELLARIRVALRHTAGASHEGSEAAFKVGDLQVDLLRRHVSMRGADVRLTPIEYKLLATLVKHAGKVVTHQQLLRDVWGPSHEDQSHYVRVYMAHLRHKLEAEPARPRYLLTEPGVGYRLAVE